MSNIHESLLPRNIISDSHHHRTHQKIIQIRSYRLLIPVDNTRLIHFFNLTIAAKESF